MREISFSYILESGWNIFRKNILTILLLVLAVAIPVSAINYFLINSKFDYEELSNELIEMQEAEISGDDSKYTANDVMDVSKKLLLFYFLSFVLSSLFIIVNCAVMKISQNTLRGEDNNFNSAFETGFRNYPKVLLTTLLFGLAVAAGMLFCFIPGFIFLYIFYLSSYSVVLSGEWGKKALHNSTLCTRKKPLLCFLVFLALIGFEIVVLFIFFILDLLFVLIGADGFIFDTVMTVVRQVLNMFPICCLSSLYISVMDEINGISVGDGVVINDSQYQNYN